MQIGSDIKTKPYTMKNKIIYWVIRIVPAVILLQTLFFKFTGSAEAVYIFTTLGVEPYGRILLGVVELITATLILIPSTSFKGAILGIGLMIGAIFSHVFVLGINVQNDGGKLFALALITLIFCIIIVSTHKKLKS